MSDTAEQERENVNLNEIWRACRKVQSTILKYGFDICRDFCTHDPKGTGLISESLFTDILGKYKSVIGLSNFELRELSDYFRLRDGRVAYRQFCKVVCTDRDDKCAPKALATGLEWNDPMHVNVLPNPEDRRQLCLILLKISQISPLPLSPYFQDYEIVSQNVGVVTIPHFSRVLHFMKIPLSDADFLMLLKRYMKDCYTVNYVAFLKHIENIKHYLKEHGLVDNAKRIITDFPGRLIDLELPELPPLDGTEMQFNVFADSCDHPKEKSECDIIFCIQQYVYKHRMRCCEFIECYDHLRTGTVTKNQFERGLYNMGMGKFLTQRDFKLLHARFIDPIDTNRIRWRVFENEINRVFTIKNLEKTPELVVKSPPKFIKELPREGTMNWGEVDERVRDMCEEALTRIQTRIRERRLHLHPFFRSYDNLKCGHVRCNLANQIFVSNGILLSTDELDALYKRYGNKLGFNYTQFLEDADPAEYAIPKLIDPASLLVECPTYADNAATQADRESDEYIIKLLSNVKRQVVTQTIPVIEFLQTYDRHREGEILEIDFRRGLDTAGIKLSVEDLDTLVSIFRSPKRACCVLYRDFCKALDEIFIQIETSMGDNVPIAVPLKHLANLDCPECFLNFDERTLCSQALMKLARKPDEISNLSDVFEDYDREKCGSIRQNQLMRALTIRDMNYMLTAREFDAICKCFGVSRGLQLEFKYREFLNVLSILFQTGQVKRNY